MLRFLPFLLLLTILTACGFHPLYGTGSRPAERQLADVSIDNIPERSGQQLRLLLTDRFYSAHAQSVQPLYHLAVTFESVKEELGIRRDDVATRARLSMTGHFTLTPYDGGKPFSGSERSFVSYNILIDPYATSAAEQNATDRGLEQIADAITNRISLYLAGNSHEGQ